MHCVGLERLAGVFKSKTRPVQDNPLNGLGSQRTGGVDGTASLVGSQSQRVWSQRASKAWGWAGRPPSMLCTTSLVEVTPERLT
jgi:hypothetical protein